MWGGTNVCTVYDNNGTELISYENLGDAFNFAVNNPNLTMHIVMTADYTLPAGDYTLPANASLLIPHKADQKKPYGEDPWRIKDWKEPSVFRTLTFAGGVNIVVKGLLEISSQQYVASTSTDGTGRVAGAYGQLNVANGCNVWLDNGSKLCAWGYMFGNGNVQAKRGATVYEMFQVYDWKGGTNVTTHFLDNHHGVFPFNQYFIQNIEMPVTYQPGSQLLTSFGITAYGEIYAVNNIGIIGTRGSKIKSMFEMVDDADEAGVWVRKSYNPTDDRQVYEINNAAYLNAMTISAMGFTFSSDAYQLPITNNMDIHLLAGFMDITQDVTMLPGSQIEVDKESIVRLLPNKNVYLYDLGQWGKYAYSNAYAKKVWDSPSWPTRKQCPRDNNPQNGVIDLTELSDASINIHGTLELYGNIFTTTNDAKTDGGANIFSTNADAGTIQFADDYTTPADSAVYQWKQTTFPEGKFYGAKAPSAWLKNETGYVKTGDLAAPAGKSLCYINDAWTNMTTVDCFVKDEANNKWYIKPAEYVQIYVEGTEPKEDEHTHLYTDVDKTRLFLLEEANCQWWEVVPKTISENTYYYCEKNGRYYSYNEDEWQEAKVVVTFNPANGQDAVLYDVKLGAVPQYAGDDPVKGQDQTGSYTFQGWKSENDETIYKFNTMPQVLAPITYTAQYNTILRKYLITFANAKDGANVYKEFAYNTPAAEVETAIGTPTKADDDIATNYEFLRWDPEIGEVTGAATYTAIFNAGTPKAYTITWLNEDGSLNKKDESQLTTSKLDPPADPTPGAGLTFAGWRNNATGVIARSEDLRNDYVTGDATYQAVFTKADSYRITFMNEEGHVYATYYPAPGEEYTCPTLSEADIPTGKQFIGWSPIIYTRAKATEDATYTAHFRDLLTNEVEVTIDGAVASSYKTFADLIDKQDKYKFKPQGNVTLKMLRNVEFLADAFDINLQPNTTLTWDLNGCEVKLTAQHRNGLTLYENDNVIICDNSEYHGGRIVMPNAEAKSFICFSPFGGRGSVTMESGAVICSNVRCFELRGEGSSVIMNGGYVESALSSSMASSYPLLEINDPNQSVEFNGGTWYINNQSSAATYAMSSPTNTYRNFQFTMNGGDIEIIGTGSASACSVTGAHIEMNNGRIRIQSENATVFDIANVDNNIYINSGEFDVKANITSGTALIIDDRFKGEIAGGKFKIEGKNSNYFATFPTTGLKGGFYNKLDESIALHLTNGFVLRPLKESDTEHANGYLYQVTQGQKITWVKGLYTLMTTGAKPEETIIPYPGGEELQWYKNEGCTEQWNFATDVMPNNALTLYTPAGDITDAEVAIIAGGNVTFSTFKNVWDGLNTKSGTIVLLKDINYTVPTTVPSLGNNLDLNLNGHKLTTSNSSSTSKISFVKVPSGKTLTITNGTATDEGEIVANNTYVETSGIIDLQGGTLVMNSGTISTTTGRAICSTTGSYNSQIDFVNGTWTVTVPKSTTAARCAILVYTSSNTNVTTVNMSGGTIQIKQTGTGTNDKAPLYVFNRYNTTTARKLNLNMTGGRLISTSNGNNTTGSAVVGTIDVNSVINISDGELIAQTYALGTSTTYNKAYIFFTKYAGSITGGKFKVEKIGTSAKSITAAYCTTTPTSTVKGGYYNIDKTKVPLGIVTGYGAVDIKEGEYGYGEYTKRVAPAYKVNWYVGNISIQTASTVEVGAKVTKFVPAGEDAATFSWYRDMALTEEWNFDTYSMPNENVNLYCKLSNPEVSYTDKDGVTTELLFSIIANKLPSSGQCTIKLLKDLTLTSGISQIYCDLTFDLNGKKITYNDSHPLLSVIGQHGAGSLMLTDNSAEQTGEIIAASVDPLFEISGEEAQFVMNGGKYTITENRYNGLIFGGSAYNAIIKINAGTIDISSCSCDYLIGGEYDDHANLPYYSSIDISGGKILLGTSTNLFNTYDDGYSRVVDNYSITGGYYNKDISAYIPTTSECTLETISDKDPLYTEGYRYYVGLKVSEEKTLTDNVSTSRVVITETGKLTVPTGKTITTKDFIIEATTTESGELINAGTVTVNGNAYFDLTFNAQAWTGSEWYSFAVPFEVDATSGISYEGAPLILGTDIDILYYDGATRAAKGANKSAWKYVENLGDKTLVPGKLYMAAFLADKPNAVRFTKKSGAELIFSGELNLDQYSSTQSTDAGWNAIANPTLHHATLTATDITEGQVYVNGEDRYAVVTLASDELVVGRPIMIQTNANKSVVINTPAASAPVRKLMTKTSSNYSVALSQDGKTTDRVIVAIDDYAIDEYTIGQDLAKAGVSTKVAQMWVDRYDAQLCKNTVAADNNMAEYPLTISAPKAGEYTIALEQIPTDGVLFLTENGSITWNLNIAPATLDLSKGTDTTYGLRLVRKSGDVVTGNNEVILNGDVQKVIINDRLYILRDGKVYNAHGHVIK